MIVTVTRALLSSLPRSATSSVRMQRTLFPLDLSFFGTAMVWSTLVFPRNPLIQMVV